MDSESYNQKVTAAALARALPHLDFETYLEIEGRATNKHEYYHGLIFAMAGGSVAPSLIAASTISQLNQKLRKKPCVVSQSDLKIVTPDAGAAFYPDAAVLCNQSLSNKAHTANAPALILEVMSPSTRNFDLNAKRKEYFRIPSLLHYLLLDSESVEAILFSREPGQTWPRDPERFSNSKDVMTLAALGISLKIGDLYLQTDLV